ncbi:AhpC/TSA antioxidant enzyme [Salibacterium halotolerans]|uniref:AhpC/TSA antioxidant enzyme n=1 Tax=Salibacterium halotolerans TaxID=1884432 RepID=A0A1I5RLQ3_9BACI|nr:AhpC/TSA antioxidant enzyme [Salibacterium halotolerans]
MREYADEFQDKRGVKIITIFPASVTLLSQFEEAYGPFPFPLYADPEKEAFRGFGHQSMNPLKLLGKAALGTMTGKVKDLLPKEEEKRKVVKTSMQKSDVFIQGGAWLFDAGRKLQWQHVDDSPENHASIEQLKEAADTYIM